MAEATADAGRLPTRVLVKHCTGRAQLAFLIIDAAQGPSMAAFRAGWPFPHGSASVLSIVCIRDSEKERGTEKRPAHRRGFSTGLRVPAVNRVLDTRQISRLCHPCGHPPGLRLSRRSRA
jgi:hypothetical protein